MKNLYWLVKREFWEHRGGFFWAPVITGGVFLLLNVMGIIVAEATGMHHNVMFGLGSDNKLELNSMIHSLNAHQMDMVGAGLDMAMLSASFLISVVFCFVVFFYCLGSLYDDRRDRSILFWKSLPISDTETVTSKVIAAVVAAPIIAIVCGVLTGMAMLLLFTMTLSLHGVSVWSLLTLAHPFQVISFMVGSLPIYVLWSLPTVGWLMLCSSWAKSKPFLWAVVIPIAVGIVLGWFHLLGLFPLKSDWYWRDVLSRVLFSVFPGGWFNEAGLEHIGKDPQAIYNFFTLSNAYSVLAKPDVWIGAVAGIAMLVLAVWFRRWRDDS
jgi:ABC-2 type transport system permease protein